MGLDIDCCDGKKYEEGHERPEEPTVATLVGKEHDDGTYSDVAARKGCYRAFSHLLGSYYQLAEYAFGFGREHLGMVFEIVGYVGEAVEGGLGGEELGGDDALVEKGLEIELRSGYGQEDEDEIEDEEGCHEDESCLIELVVAAKEIEEYRSSYHVII